MTGDNKHHEMHAHVMQGGFAVQIGSQNPFGHIPVDQAIEETVNKDTRRHQRFQPERWSCGKVLSDIRVLQ